MPTVRTPDWSRLVVVYSSWRCYHTPRYATYVFVFLTSIPRLAAIIGLYECRTEPPSQLWPPISVLAPNLWGKRQTPYLLKREGLVKCAMGMQNACFSKAEKLTHTPCPQGKVRRAGDTTTLHSLMPAPAFAGRVSTPALSPYLAC